MKIKLSNLAMGLLAVITLTLGVAAPAAQASASHPATHAGSGYTVQQVNPTTWTNVLVKKVPAIPLVQGNWIIKTRSGSAVREVTAEGLDITMQLHQTGFSTFNKSRPAGATADIYTTPGGGLCMHGTTNDLVIGSNNCGASNTSSQFYGDGSGRLECVCDGNYLGANSNSEGASVRLGPSSGLYYLTPFNIG